MNNTKWTEIFQAFYYGIELSSDKELSGLQVLWTTKSLDGFIYSDSTGHISDARWNLRKRLIG